VVSQFKPEEGFCRDSEKGRKSLPCFGPGPGNLHAHRVPRIRALRIKIKYAVSRRSAFQAAQHAFRSKWLSHEIGRKNLPRGKVYLQFAAKAKKQRAKLTKLASIRILILVILEYLF
jgi:hypothetical protein